MKLTPGRPEPLGATPDPQGCNFAVFSANATAIEVCLFDGQAETRIALTERTGDVFHGHVAGVKPGARYGLRAHGRFAPHEGHRFDPRKLLIDPYALALDGPLILDPQMLPGGGADTAPLVAKAIVTAPIAGPGARNPLVPWDRTVIYELPIKGFTKACPDIPREIAGTFAALAHPAAIKRLTDLGVTTVELMPAMAWIDERHLGPLGLTNYWGYNPIAWMAPDPRLAPGGWKEVAAATEALAKAGIETLLDVVFNHSGEGDELGPTISMRGLDNASYYRLQTADKALYINDAGCGNILDPDQPAVVRLVLDSLRTWATLGGLSGFRFDLMSTLGRRPEGFDARHALLTAIVQDPILRDLKIIAEPWDCGPGGYQLGAFPAAFGEWNDGYRDDVRRFWRGDGGMTGALAGRLAGSESAFGAKYRPSRSVNFITAHDGFTLADLTAYSHKHNEGNGEQNRDGTDSNNSWNHGIEGPSEDATIDALRVADQRALLTLLLASRGTPMLSMGAESGQSQAGNNNAYAQDNMLAWLDWQESDQALMAFTGHLIRLRASHPALRADRFLTGGVFDDSLLPDVQWLDARGRPMDEADWRDRPFLTAVLAAPGENGPDRVAIVVNRADTSSLACLPPARDGYGWRLACESAGGRTEPLALDEDEFEIAARAVAICVEVADDARRPRGLSPQTLDRLALAAGVNPAWKDLTGEMHQAPDDTRRACLTAMGLDVTGESAAREGLQALAQERSRRALPLSWHAREDEPVMLPLATASGAEPSGGLVIEDEGGVITEMPLDLGGRTGGFAEDGRPHEARLARLPRLGAGRYRIWRTDAPDAPMRLTIAPSRCWTPQPLERKFGISAQLYTLRRAGDQGIGDYVTLSELARRAGAAGAACLGINPLHMMFPADRERASPYHGSDRRFLDPIHLDCGPYGAPSIEGGRIVDYPSVWAAKSTALEAAFAKADTAGLDDFIAAGGESLRRFCLFQAIAETLPGKAWMQWPTGLQSPDGTEAQVFAKARAGRLRYHAWLQQKGDQQLAAAAASGKVAGLGLGLYRDLAVGSALDGAEIWSQPDGVCRGVSVGAPPDAFSPEGQVWALPPPNPLHLHRTGCADFAELLGANMRHAGALRIDHVLGLARLFWVPDGAPGAAGAYVDLPRDALLAELCLESQRAKCLVVGEDLGIAPEGLREAMAERDILSYRVLHFERQGRGFIPPEHYPLLSTACLATHDIPTFAGWRAGADILERQDLGLADETQTAAALAERALDKEALNEAAGGEDAATAHAFAARAGSALFLVQADDLAGETVAVNLPGTDRQRPNWRRRLEPPVERLLETGDAPGILEAIRRERP